MIFFRYLILSTISILVVVVSLNFCIDPGVTFPPSLFDPTKYANVLVNTKHGLWYRDNSYSERGIKKALSANTHNADCIIIGSSRILSISALRAPRSLPICTSILNLGVSGAGLQDHLALGVLSLQNSPPKKIVLAIDPWTLSTDLDVRWAYYAADFWYALSAIGFQENTYPSDANRGVLARKIIHLLYNKETNPAFFKEQLQNLLSLKYSAESFSLALKIISGKTPYAIEEAGDLNIEEGGEYPVYLPDGSMINSAYYISQAKKIAPIFRGTGYKVGTDKMGVNMYVKFLVWLRSKGVEPIILLVPYHQSIWMSGDNKLTFGIKRTEDVVHKIGHLMNLKVIGSFYPDNVGCISTEFYDFMHPTADCLAKLK